MAFFPEKHSVRKVPPSSLCHTNNLKAEMLVMYMLSLETSGSHITNTCLTYQRMNTRDCSQDGGIGRQDEEGAALQYWDSKRLSKKQDHKMKVDQNGMQHSKEKRAEFLTYSSENDLQKGCCSLACEYHEETENDCW